MKQRMLQPFATFCRGQTFKGNQEGIFQVVHDQTNELENHHRCILESSSTQRFSFPALHCCVAVVNNVL